MSVVAAQSSVDNVSTTKCFAVTLAMAFIVSKTMCFAVTLAMAFIVDEFEECTAGVFQPDDQN